MTNEKLSHSIAGSLFTSSNPDNFLNYKRQFIKQAEH